MPKFVPDDAVDRAIGSADMEGIETSPEMERLLRDLAHGEISKEEFDQAVERLVGIKPQSTLEQP